MSLHCVFLHLCCTHRVLSTLCSTLLRLFFRPGSLQVYRAINNGVYRAGFSTSQAAYDAAVGEMHDLLAALDRQLGETRFLLGDK